jgi:XTP/dITP diphosphohydrolase
VVEFVAATANAHKLGEMEEILAALGSFRLTPRPLSVGDIVEDGETFVDNALIKAFAICEATGKAALADDSGICVDALDGAPGVRSARYSGEGATDAENRRALLAALEGVTSRTATFVAAVAVAFPDGTAIVAEGIVPGTVATEEHGTDGFGYDPLFRPDGAGGRTFAEMTAEEKHEISHRRRALEDLVAALEHQGRC